jgi:hypothetical protein
LDVVPPGPRTGIVAAASRNLRKGGVYIVIVPRNDQTILVRCAPENKYRDGHIFSKGSIVTFYRNWRDHSKIAAMLEARQIEVAADLSIYRHVCLIGVKG